MSTVPDGLKLSPKALAFTMGLLWGGAILFVGLVNLAAPDYGEDFLGVMSEVYPGFHEEQRSFGNVLVGTAYGLLDGAIGGFLVAWLYNFFSRRSA